MILRKTFFFLLLAASIAASYPTMAERGENMRITVMTLGPYQGELYSAFGHSAIHLEDTVADVNYVFNYGVFNFEQENFYWNFARGKMLYELGLSYYDRFISHYIADNRYIIEQELNLTSAEKWEVYKFMSNNHLPENRAYYYNYVYDNCATKIPEVLAKAIPATVTYDYSFTEEGVTIRDLMDRYLAYQPWGDWIIDIGLGLQIDKVADPQEYLFLPDYVQKSLENATITRDSVTVPMVSKTINVYTPTPETFENGAFTPFNVFVLLFFVVGFFTNRDFKTGKRTHWVDVVVFTFVGIIGWWCAFLWLGTDHLSKMNFNLLWAIPLHIPFVYFLKSPKLQPFASKYFLVCSILYLVLLVVWGMLPQPLHMALIPLILTMALRGFFIHYDLNKYSRKVAAGLSQN
ncbi:DUF4105 domain-containing protein [Marinoscillum sp. MHG1-6]|uniref:DUF4105 domain-containing protein n=1 Tax=Marinoscillum sp. MHG1-6 TaxID=2959627 RepID=UPI002157C108|nr:DUF4105 domain-containing protein [Marinoscillum sp. MHG1-6]